MSETDATTAETAESAAAANSGEPIQLPADHPLVRTLEKLRAETKSLRESDKAGAEAVRRLAEIEEANKTESQKLADKAAVSDKEAASARGELLRLRVAMRKGLTETQAKRLIGSSEEDLAADADELLASFRQEHEDDRADEKEDVRPTRPKEKLKSGATGADRSDLPQLTREDLRGMSPDAIEAARVAGQLDKIQGIR